MYYTPTSRHMLRLLYAPQGKRKEVYPMNGTQMRLTDAQRELVEYNIGIARSVAWKYYKAYIRYGMDWNDVFSTACMGLMRAMRTYDPQKAKNTSYLFHACRQELLMVIRKQSAKCRGAFETVSLQDACACNQRGEELRIEDVLPANEPMPDEAVINRDTEAEVRRILRSVSDVRDKRVLAMRMDGFTHKDIAQALNLSQSHVARILRRIRSSVREVIA